MVVDDELERLELFYCVLKSIDNYSEIEIWGVVNGVLAPSPYEECVIATYSRAFGNVKSLLELKSVRHVQAIGMIARSLFELTVDIKLVDVLKLEGSVVKMLHFKDLERLKACESISTFKQRQVGSDPAASIRSSFISTEGPRIRNVASQLWPGEDLKRLNHWSGLKLHARAKLLGTDFEEIYACQYKPLSWNVHPGLQGVAGMKREAFSDLCVQSLHLSAIMYEKLLKSVIKTFKLFKHDGSIEDKLKFAHYLPFTDGPIDVAALRRDLGL